MTNPKKSNQEIKKALYELCCDYVHKRRETVQKTINEIQESLTSETKSSAGDKHETGRAMLQLEREKAGQQLAELEKLEFNLSKIDITNTSSSVGLGSIIYTSQNNYFISISAGELIIDDASFYAISPNTPIGLLLMGKTIGDQVTFRTQQIDIQNVY